MNVLRLFFLLSCVATSSAFSSLQQLDLKMVQAHILPRLSFVDAVALTNASKHFRRLRLTPQFNQIIANSTDEFAVTEGLTTVEDLLVARCALRVNESVQGPGKLKSPDLKRRCIQHPHLARHMANVRRVPCVKLEGKYFDLALLYDQDCVTTVPSGLEGLFHSSMNLTTLNLCAVPEKRDKRALLGYVAQCRTLQSLHLDSSFSVADIQFYCSQFDADKKGKLRELILLPHDSSQHFSEGIFLKVLETFPQLTELKLSDCCFSKVVDFPDMENLTILKIANDQGQSLFLSSLAKNLDRLPKLRELVITSAYKDEQVMPFYRGVSQERPDIQLNCLTSQDITLGALHDAVEILKENGCRYFLYCSGKFDTDPIIENYAKTWRLSQGFSHVSSARWGSRPFNQHTYGY